MARVFQRSKHSKYPAPSIGCLLLHQALCWWEDPDEDGVFMCEKCKKMFYSTRHTNYN